MKMMMGGEGKGLKLLDQKQLQKKKRKNAQTQKAMEWSEDNASKRKATTTNHKDNVTGKSYRMEKLQGTLKTDSRRKKKTRQTQYTPKQDNFEITAS